MKQVLSGRASAVTSTGLAIDIGALTDAQCLGCPRKFVIEFCADSTVDVSLCYPGQSIGVSSTVARGATAGSSPVRSVVISVPLGATTTANPRLYSVSNTTAHYSVFLFDDVTP